jgi:hypothetical protein
MKRTGGLLLLFTFVVLALAQTGGRASIPTCGFGATSQAMRECRCADRTSRIRAAIIASCNDVREGKERDACVKSRLAGRDHCSIAERWTEYDRDSSGQYPTGPHGDDEHSNMGPACKMSCARHHCACTELLCHFGESEDEIKQENKSK